MVSQCFFSRNDIIIYLFIFWVLTFQCLVCRSLKKSVCVIASLLRSFRLVVLSVVVFGLPYGSDKSCSETLVDHGRGYLGILVSCLICESAIMWLSMRGSILYTQPREAVQYVLYIRLGKTCWDVKFLGLFFCVLTLCMIESGALLFCLVCIVFTFTNWSWVSSHTLPLFLSSYSVGWARVCCRGHCLACPVLQTMLWCHCQKLGFGWVKRGYKGEWERFK